MFAGFVGLGRIYRNLNTKIFRGYDIGLAGVYFFGYSSAGSTTELLS